MQTFLHRLILALPLCCLLGCQSPPSTESTESSVAADPMAALAEIDPETGFALHAFPPTLSDIDYHQNGWKTLDCMDCHEEGIADAPLVQHVGLPEQLLTAQCRSCHVLIPGQPAIEIVVQSE